MQGSPSLVKGARLRTLSRRRSWVRIPLPAPCRLWAFFVWDGPVFRRLQALDPLFGVLENFFVFVFIGLVEEGGGRKRWHWRWFAHRRGGVEGV